MSVKQQVDLQVNLSKEQQVDSSKEQQIDAQVDLSKEQQIDRSENIQDFVKDFTERFWELIDKQMGCSVPMYIKNILRLRGFENAASIKTLTREDYKEFENFARTKMEKFIPPNSNRKDYYHMFSSNTRMFEILPGHVRLLDEIVKHIVVMTESHGTAYFDPDSKMETEAVNRRRKGRGGALTLPRKVPRLLSSVKFSAESFELPTKTRVQAQAAKLQDNSNNIGENTVSITESSLKEILSPHQPESLISTTDNLTSNCMQEEMKNLLKERKRLFQNIKRWLEKKGAGDLFEQLSECNNLQILEEDQVDEENDQQNKKKLSLSFFCPICKEPIGITKSTKFSNGREFTYYSISNVSRHFKLKHLKLDSKNYSTITIPEKLVEKRSGQNKRRMKITTSDSESDNDLDDDLIATEMEKNFINESEDAISEDGISDDLGNSTGDTKNDDQTIVSEPIVRQMPKLRKI